MFAVNGVKNSLIKHSNKTKEENFIPITTLPDAIDYYKYVPNKEYPRSSARHRDLIYLKNENLIEPQINKYFYNACICDNRNSYRLFYRVGKEPKGYEDKLATCLLDNELNVIPSSNKYLNVYSNWDASVVSFKMKQLIPFKFKNGTHVEDPRAVLFYNYWFIFYTDGSRIGVAKLPFDCSKTLYSHYLSPITGSQHLETDGREKNWIPFVSNSNLYILYSDNPRTIFTCFDNEDSLQLVRVKYHTLISSPSWAYGNIRGGCPPVKYDDNHLIWFFHSQKVYETHVGLKNVYMIGAYISKNTYPFEFKNIITSPILIGIPHEISETLSLQDCVVFPCGCVNTKDGWRISMGINDQEIAFIDITEKHLFWGTRIIIPSYSRLSSN
jgi:predicted GH43/DUF377 family glycosyl hydrolase